MHFKKSVLKNHLLYSIITLMAIAMLFPITAFAQAYVQTWDLVDSGKPKSGYNSTNTQVGMGMENYQSQLSTAFVSGNVDFR